MSDQHPGSPQYPGQGQPQQPPQPAYGQQPGPAPQQSAYGQQPVPAQQPGFGQQQPVQPPAGSVQPVAPKPVPDLPFASWGLRAVAAIVDWAVVYVPALILFLIWRFAVNPIIWSRDYAWETPPGSLGASNALVFLFLMFLALLFNLWNLGVRQGRTGQSIGKRIVGVRAVSAERLEPTGVGTGIVRYLLNVVLSGLCFVNWLWPLFDARRQTWHDMIVKTYVLAEKKNAKAPTTQPLAQSAPQPALGQQTAPGPHQPPPAPQSYPQASQPPPPAPHQPPSH